MNMLSTATMTPAAPRHVEDLGLSLTFLRDLLVKTMLRTNITNIPALATVMGITAPITQELIDRAREQNYIETLGASRLDDHRDLRYQLTEGGRRLAFDSLEQSEYYGKVPVPLPVFEKQVARQSIRNATITRARLEQSFAGLIIDDEMLDELGPAVNSHRSVLMYGPPGNGKSSIAQALRDAYEDNIYVPHAIEYEGNVISLYDPLVHRRAPDEITESSTLRLSQHSGDLRYVRCERPALITGGELTLDMLDLTYNPVSRTYQAPLQMKSTGGVFIVDDLGRQSCSPQSLVNRWIVPMEQGFDILTLQSGQKFVVPFDTKVVFSTNFPPTKIFDAAALRRIYYKIHVTHPSRETFIKIFVMTARNYPIEFDEKVLAYLIQERYPLIDNKYSAFHAPFLMEQMLATCQYRGQVPKMTIELADKAWEHLFVRDDD